MQIESRLSDQLAHYLDLAVSEAKVTAANIANIDTPGYRTVGFDFEAEMRKAITTQDGASAISPHILEVDGLISRGDGNNVSMDREGVETRRGTIKVQNGRRSYAHPEPARHGCNSLRQETGDFQRGA